ncbi:MAG TPA: hypothetical protein VF791_12340 [Pyrinomonadaceae bacterium]
MFLPDESVRVAALSEYGDHWVSDRLLQRPPEQTRVRSQERGA